MEKKWCFSVIGGVPVGDGYPVRIMAIMNLGPESFYKRSVFTDEKEIERYALRVESEGASFLDVGGASSAPPEIYEVRPVPESEELERVVRAIRLLKDVTELPISVDTRRASVAEAALKEGAEIVNDVSGFKEDKRMASVVADFDASCVLMATVKKPGDARSIVEVRRSLRESIRLAEDAGVSPEKIIIDPGIGFGKPYECDLELLRGLRRLKLLRKPLLVGVSRKHFIGCILGLPKPEDRLIGSIAATAIAIRNGADVVRVHDVSEARQAALVAQAISNRRTGFAERGSYFAVNLSDLIADVSDVEELMEHVGVSEVGSKLMSEKGVHYVIFLGNVPTPAALALKQHLLSAGGDVATPRGAIDFNVEKCNLLVMATLKQLKSVISKLKINAFDLPLIADLLLKCLEE
ncbi:MAG: dihydropteroate synthase [Candidatus Freyarchaeota archaeon]|nr:dihydropteroate synthase [Candidatus Jordarchaeia archaeon]